MDHNAEVSIIRPLSTTTISLLDQDQKLSSAFIGLLHKCKITWRSPTSPWQTILRASPDICIKTVPDDEDLTGYSTLEYLALHKPEFSAPKPHGVLRSHDTLFIFMSYVPGVTLASVWRNLQPPSKGRIQEQLNNILIDLRSLPFPEHLMLGGVAGEGCKDLRRHLRHCKEPITGAESFEDFLFSNPNFGSEIFISFLRRMAPTKPRIVFTHGDLHLENIIVNSTESGEFSVVGLIDWELSGFYPDWWESVRMTNCLATNEKSDWFLWLPECVSPRRFAHRWLMDRIWGHHIE